MSIRLVLFADRPHTMLVFVPEDDTDGFVLPRLQSPFTLESVRAALVEARTKDRFRVELLPSATRYDAVIRKKLLDARSERAQKDKLARSSFILAQKTSNSEEERDRAALLERKETLDDRLRRAKAELSSARTLASTSGNYMHPAAYRRLENEVNALTTESQALQTRIGEASQSIKAANIKKNTGVLRLFKDIASQKLPLELFREIMGEALEENDRIQNA